MPLSPNLLLFVFALVFHLLFSALGFAVSLVDLLSFVGQFDIRLLFPQDDIFVLKRESLKY